MRKFYTGVVNHRKLIIALFAIAFIVCFVCSKLVSVNYDMKDYLPEGTKSTLSLELMQEEFSGGIPNARAMVRNVSIPEALECKEKIKAEAAKRGLSVNELIVRALEEKYNLNLHK